MTETYGQEMNKLLLEMSPNQDSYRYDGDEVDDQKKPNIVDLLE